MADNNLVQPDHVLLLPNPNGNGHSPKPINAETLPDPTALRQVDLHALRLYAVGKPWTHPLIDPKLAALLEAQVDAVVLINSLGILISATVFRLDPNNLPPLELTVDDLHQMLERATDKSIAKQTAMQIIGEAAHLEQADLLEFTEYMHDEVSLSYSFIRKWEQAVKKKRQEYAAHQEADQAVKLQAILSETRQANPSWPYAALNGQTCYQTLNQHGEVMAHLIADFTAEIVATIQPECGNPIHQVKGMTFTGKTFELNIESDQFQDIKVVTGLLSAAIARDPRAGIAPGMAQHLPLAIHRLSTSEIPTIQLFRRTGWANGQFIMPGRTLPNIQIDVISDLPYNLPATAELTQGLQALMYLIDSVGKQNSLPALMSFFAAPLADKIGLRDERYVTLIQGRTGKFKTSWSQIAMCLYGPGFAAERSLIKWGDGATTNAIEALASSAHDLPMLVDNYKPGTGEGERGLIKLVHRMAEGGARRRLDRNAMLRPTADIYSWLIMTGEDAPQNDTATTARMLWINFDNQPQDAAQKLAVVQKNQQHLSAIGRTWIAWLENPENQPILDTWCQQFPTLRQKYLELILKINPDAINGNPRRIAQNLAFNHLTWEILRCSPIGPYINHEKEYKEGLQTILRTMALATVQSNPGNIFVQALRDLLSTGRALLIDPNFVSAPPTPGVATPLPKPGIVGPNELTSGDVAGRVIGYVAPNDGAYLLPDVARAAVERLLGKDALAQTTNNALYKRLDEMGCLASKAKDGNLICKKIDGRTRRVLHLNASVMEPSSGTGTTTVI